MKQKTPTPKFPRRPVTDLDRKLVELRARERELDAEIIELESQGFTRTESAAPVEDEIETQAYSLLTATPPAAATSKPTVQSRYREREIIRRALEIGAEMSREERTEWQRIAISDRMNFWRSLVRETAVLVIQLQKVNRSREEFKAALGGMPSLPCNTGSAALLGVGASGDETKRFVQSVLKAGIMTQGEVDKLQD